MTKKAIASAIITATNKNNTEIKKELSVKSATVPLQVIVGRCIQQDQGQEQSAVAGAVATNNFMASSPAGSVDSGISSSSNSSPASSPECSPVSVRGAPFQYEAVVLLLTLEMPFQPIFLVNKKADRQLIDGTSVGAVLVYQLHWWSLENGENEADKFKSTGAEQKSQQRGRSTSESQCATNGLKSILKKTSPNYIAFGRFTRSHSECQSIEEEGDFKMIAIDAIDEENEDRIPRKKHVSFSERLVQERSFRPNSSILGQRKKNRRKQKNKQKKKAARATSLEGGNSTDDEVRHRSDSDTSHPDVVCVESEDDTDPVVCDFAACELEDNVVDEEANDNSVKNEQKATVAAKIRKRTLRSSTGEEQRVYFTVGE